MQNWRTLPKRKILQCLRRDCCCEKCSQFRLPSERDASFQCNARNKSNEEIVNSETPESDHTENQGHQSQSFAKLKAFRFPFKFGPRDFSSFLCDLVGIISFFIMISIVFWITVTQYLWCWARKVLQAGRSVKLLALTVLLVLCGLITYHALIGANHGKPSSPHLSNATYGSLPASRGQMRPAAAVQQVHRNCLHKNCLLAKSGKSNEPSTQEEKQCDCDKASDPSLHRRHPSLCDLCAEKFRTEKKTPTPSLSDEEAREMYKKFKLYGVASEMKFPPSFGLVFEVLSGLLDGLLNSANRTLF